MSFDYNKQLKDFTGALIVNQAQEPLTFKDLAVQALRSPLPGDEAMPILDKVSLGMTCKAMMDGLTVPVEDAIKIKDRICRMFSAPHIAYAVQTFMDEATSGHAGTGAEKAAKAAPKAAAAKKEKAAKAEKVKAEKVKGLPVEQHQD